MCYCDCITFVERAMTILDVVVVVVSWREQ